MRKIIFYNSAARSGHDTLKEAQSHNDTALSNRLSLKLEFNFIFC